MGREARKGLYRITNTLALRLPFAMMPFLYVCEGLGTAVGVLTQLLCSWHHPVACLSKQLDAVS
jgi:hypothetical protein